MELHENVELLLLLIGGTVGRRDPMTPRKAFLLHPVHSHRRPHVRDTSPRGPAGVVVVVDSTILVSVADRRMGGWMDGSGRNLFMKLEPPCGCVLGCAKWVE